VESSSSFLYVQGNFIMQGHKIIMETRPVSRKHETKGKTETAEQNCETSAKHRKMCVKQVIFLEKGSAMVAPC